MRKSIFAPNGGREAALTPLSVSRARKLEIARPTGRNAGFAPPPRRADPSPARAIAGGDIDMYHPVRFNVANFGAMSDGRF